MRTTVRLPDELYRSAKTRAADTGRTLTQFLEDAVRSALAHSPADAEDPDRFEIEPFSGNGLRPGVDLDDTAALLDRMEGR